VNLEPAFDAFADAYAAGRPQVVWTRLIDDLETPVSAYLKIAKGQPFAFLFESVEGGAWRGRYSVVAMQPELIWRCRGDKADDKGRHPLSLFIVPANHPGISKTPIETALHVPETSFTVFFDEVRVGAEALVGHALLVPASDRPPLAEGEFHLLDLVGLEVRLLADGRGIGRVTDLLHAGNDLLEVELAAAPGIGEPAEQTKPRRILIPFVEPIVPEVHLGEGWLGITPPPGLLEI
jgi:16S rRNA processing protein RimM